jgi:hypothetical protein
MFTFIKTKRKELLILFYLVEKIYALTLEMKGKLN